MAVETAVVFPFCAVNYSLWWLGLVVTSFITTTLQLQPFYGPLDFVQDNPGEPVPER